MANFVLLKKDDKYGFTHKLYQVSEITGLIQRFTGICVYEQIDEEGESFFIVPDNDRPINPLQDEKSLLRTLKEAGEVAIKLATKNFCPCCKEKL